MKFVTKKNWRFVPSPYFWEKFLPLSPKKFFGILSKTHFLQYVCSPKFRLEIWSFFIKQKTNSNYIFLHCFTLNIVKISNKIRLSTWIHFKIKNIFFICYSGAEFRATCAGPASENVTCSTTPCGTGIYRLWKPIHSIFNYIY